MTYQEINTLISQIAQELECDYNYCAFEDEISRSRYLVFIFNENNDFYADNENYAENACLDIEFYSSEKSIQDERIIEKYLKSHDICYQKDNAYISQEKIFETIYSTEVLIDG